MANTDRKLRDGDVVGIESPDAGFFFTGGRLPGGQYPLPPGRRISVQQAAAMAGGPANRTGAFGPSQFFIVRANGTAVRVGNPSRVAVRPEDTIILRNTPAEAVGNIVVGAGQATLRSQ